jgi:membrane protease subunit (stomatin/prohibitin family)
MNFQQETNLSSNYMTWLEKYTIHHAAIESTKSAAQHLCWRAEFNHNKLKLNSTITVQEGQIALVLLNQNIIAILENGSYPLHWICEVSSNLTSLDVYFFTTKTFTDQRWGTASPILVKDSNGDMISLRAHGTFAYELDNPKRLWRHIPNESQHYSAEDIVGELRSIILDTFSKTINQSTTGIQQVTSQREQLTQEVINALKPVFTDYGLTLKSFLIQSISIPEGSTSDNFSKLEKLKALYQQGVLTLEEYERKKKDLLKDL